LRQRYDLPRDSVAEATLRLIDAGYTEADAARLMLESFERAVQAQRAVREPWISEAEHLIHQKESAET
jgi:hypothetical protein